MNRGAFAATRQDLESATVLFAMKNTIKETTNAVICHPKKIVTRFIPRVNPSPVFSVATGIAIDTTNRIIQTISMRIIAADDLVLISDAGSFI